MEITWQGHSCFRLRADDLVVVTDPFPASVGLSPDSRPATMVTVSNSHPNHSYLQDVAEGAKVF
ncbi:MAG: MBL fold metallo-hydrolase, partial [Acidobacteria bacterium]|nr:MBL fold metallo-hydrolase [Acidobacteriota bacterium]